MLQVWESMFKTVALSSPFFSAKGCLISRDTTPRAGYLHAAPVNPILYDAGLAIEARRKRALAAWKRAKLPAACASAGEEGQ